MEGFAVATLCKALSLAILADGKSMSPGCISDLLRSAAKENGAPVDGETLPIGTMFLIFSDFSDRLGQTLGHSIEPDGFALDWAGDYPHLRKACAQIQVLVVGAMSNASRQFRAINGFGMEDIFSRMMSDETTPEVAAAQLERERQHHTIH